jgi:hypothetical protein
VFVDSTSHEVTDVLQMPGPASNWNWGHGLRHQTVYVTLANEPNLIVVDAARFEVLESVTLSTVPEPAGLGPSIYISRTGGVFVASLDSVTFLSQG